MILGKTLSVIRTVTRWMLDLAAVILGVALLLRIIGIDDHFWLLDVLAIFLPWVLLATLALFAIALWRGRWMAVIFLGFAIVAMVGMFGRLLVPRIIKTKNPPPTPTATHLTVMTYNLGKGMAPSQSLLDVIQEINPDFIAIQELDTAQVTELRLGLEDRYPYQVFHGVGIPGIGFISRYPIADETLFYLQNRNPYLRVQLTIEGQTLTVYNIHPSVEFGPGCQVEDCGGDIPVLATRAAAEDTPLIVMGDFNFSDQNRRFQYFIDHGFIDVFNTAGFGFGLTFLKRDLFNSNFNFPLFQLDHILVSDGFTPIRAWIGPDGGSDHLPLVTELIWPIRISHHDRRGDIKGFEQAEIELFLIR